MNTLKPLAIIAIAAATVMGCTQKKDTAPPEEPQACTEEAKVCEDGSSVSREGPECEFAACPGEVEAASVDAVPEDEDAPIEEPEPAADAAAEDAPEEAS